MTLRVTNQTMYTAESRNLQSSLAALATAQQQAQTGLAILKPSDDPSGTVAAMSVRVQQSQNAQYKRNLADASSWTTATDTALTQTSSLLRSARDLAVQSVNGTNNPASLNALADQLESIKQGLLSQANTKVGGRSVFAGTSDQPNAVAATGSPASYAFTGNAGDEVLRRVGPGDTVRVDVDGSTVFGGSTPNSMFDDLDAMIAQLRSGQNLSGATGTFDSWISNVGSVQATVGAAQNQLQAAQTVQAAQVVSLTQQQNAVEDVDTAAAAIALQNANNVYQATLLVTANSGQANLTDFLK